MEDNKNLMVEKTKNTKLFAIIGLIAVALVAGFFIFKNLNKGGPLNKNEQIISAIVDLGNQYEESVDDFYQPLGLKQISEKVKNGQLGLLASAVINKEALNAPEDLTINWSLAADVSKKHGYMSLEAKFKDQSFLSGSIILNHDQLIADVPALFDKALSINLKTIGMDIHNSSFVNLSEDIEVESLKDLSIDLWKSPVTFNQYKEEILKLTETETKAFKDKLNFVELEKHKVNVAEKEVALDTYESVIPKDELIALIDAYQKAMLEVNNGKITGIDLEKQIPNEEIKDWKESFEKEWDRFEEPIKLIVGMDGNKVRYLEFKNKVDGNPVALSVELLGEKIPFKDLFVKHGLVGEKDHGQYKLTTVKNGDVNTMIISGMLVEDTQLHEFGKIEFNTSTHDLTLEGQGVKLIATIDNIVKGESFEFNLKDMIVDNQSVMNDLKSLQLKIDKPSLHELPTETLEVLKMSQEEAQYFMMSVVMRLISLGGQIGIDIPIN